MEKETNTVTEPVKTEQEQAAAGTETKSAESPKAEEQATENKSTEKTYDQAYIDRMLAYQKKAQDEAVAEALKVAGMDADSKAAYEKEQEEKRLKDREAEIARRELKADAREVLAQKEVPETFLDILVGKDLEETKANVDAFKKQFDLSVQAQVEKRLSGKTPSGGNGGGTPSEMETMSKEMDKYMN